MSYPTCLTRTRRPPIVEVNLTFPRIASVWWATVVMLCRVSNPNTLDRTLVRAAFPKCHVLGAVPSRMAADHVEMPSWAPPCAAASCLICIVSICTASLGGGMGCEEVQGVAGEIRGKEAVKDQLLHSPPHHALQLCLKAWARAGHETPKNREGVSDVEQERQGESRRAGEMGLGNAAGAGAPKLSLSMCSWLAVVRRECGFWEWSWLASSQAGVFLAGCGFGTRFLFQLLPRCMVWIWSFSVAHGSVPKVPGLGGYCHPWLPQDPFPMMMELRCGCSPIPFCHCKVFYSKLD